MADRSSQPNDPRPCPALGGAPSARRRSGWLPALLASLGALACATRPPPLAPGSVRGRLLHTGGEAEATAEPVVVFLEPLDAAARPPAPGEVPVLRPSDRGFAPAVLAVAAGQSVRIANDAAIYHRIFSYSESNPFDLGVVRRGDARSVAFRNPGVVRIYCSLHPSERAIVFVAPSPYFATFRPPERYEIQGVPPGRYRLRAFGESVDAEVRAVTVRSGAWVTAEIAARPLAAPE